MYRGFSRVRIEAFAGVVGKKRLSTHDHGLKLGIDGKRLARLVATTGFESLSEVSPNVTVGDMAVEGFRHLSRAVNVSPGQIGALYLVTQSPDYVIPSTSYTIQQRLGLGEDALLIDLAQGCPATVLAMFKAAVLIEAGICERVLIAAGDLSTHMPPPGIDQPESYLINGEGCGLVLMGRKEPDARSGANGGEDLFFCIRSHGEMYHSIIDYSTGARPARNPEPQTAGRGFCVDGSMMELYALDIMSKEIMGFLGMTGLSVADLGVCIAQQSNRTMLRALAAVLDADDGWLPFLAGEYGNLSSASIPVVLASHGEGLGKIRSRPTLLCADGVGMATSLCIADLSATKFAGTVAL